MKRIPISIGFLLLLITSITSPAQTPKKDSLISLVNPKAISKSQADVLAALSLAYYKLKNDSSFYYAKQSLTLSENINYTKGIGESYLLLGRIHRRKNKINDAIIFYEQAEKNFIKINATDRLASVYNNLGLVKKRQGNFKKANYYYMQSLQRYRKVNDLIGEAKALNNIGTIYFRTGNYKKSTQYYIDALKIWEESEDNSGVASTLGNLGNLSLEQKDYDKALVYYDNAKTKFLELNNTQKAAIPLIGIGEIYKKTNHKGRALASYQEALKYFKQSNTSTMIASTLGSIGELYYETGNYRKALENQYESLQFCLEIEDILGEAQAYKDIGLLQIQLGEYTQALVSLSKALSIAKSIGSKQTILECYHGFSLYHKSQKEFKISLDYLEKHTALKDSLFSIEKSAEISRIQTEYETEKKNNENEILRQEQKANTALIEQQELQNKVQLGAIILFFALATYFYNVYRQKQKKNEHISKQNLEITASKAKLQILNTSLASTVKERTQDLEDINFELDTFLYQSSHALRRPMASAMGLTRLAKMKKTSPEVDGIYDRMDETLNKMDFMLNKLVTASEISFIDLAFTEVKFNEVIDNIAKSLKGAIKNSRAKLTYNIANNITFYSDQRLVTIILENLIENALAFQKTHEKNPVIIITIENQDDKIKITVHDNGIGIPPMIIDTVFDMFIVGTGQSQGYGLGLYLVKKATKRIHGTVQVDSKLDRYSTFEIII